MVSQAFLLSNIHIRSLQKAENLTQKLSKINISLEDEIKERTKEIRSAYQKLKKLSGFKNSLTSMIVHDLKNPLNSIMNITVKKEVKEAGRVMLNLVMNILDVNKFEDTKVALNLRNYQIQKTANTAIGQVAFLCNRRNIRIINAITTDLCSKFDHDHLERVFVNLLTNAIKYSQPGSSIHIGSLVSNKEVVKLYVKDSGQGIDKSKKELIFGKFGQVDAEKSGITNSTGLGLAYCKMVIEAHGGKIDFDSEEGEGTIFWFTLPKVERKEFEKVEQMNVGGSILTVNLSKNDWIYLHNFIQKFKGHELYEVSYFKRILKNIEATENSEIAKWKEEISVAIKNGNKKKFNQLLNNGEL